MTTVVEIDLDLGDVITVGATRSRFGAYVLRVGVKGGAAMVRIGSDDPAKILAAIELMRRTFCKSVGLPDGGKED